MQFEIRKRRRTNLLPFVIAAVVIMLAVGLYVWNYVLSDQGISTDAEKSFTEETSAEKSLAEETAESATQAVIHAGSRRVTADIPGQAGQADQAADWQGASLQSAGQQEAEQSTGRRNTAGTITSKHSDATAPSMQDVPEFSVINEEPNYALFLICEEGYITAYLGDQTDIYEYTQIPLTSFPEEQQRMLEEGLYMETFADYYDFLESYTS